MVSEATPQRAPLLPLSKKGQSAWDLVQLGLPLRRRVAYVGWLGHANLGDEAMFQAYRRELPRLRFMQAPTSRQLDRVERIFGRRPISAVMLGGGTLIGWPGYRRTLESLLSRYPDLPVFMLGTGVEDPATYDRYRKLVESLTAAESRESVIPVETRNLLEQELQRWVPLLQRMQKVTVRGERSREILRSVGVDSISVGDPALLLTDDPPHDPVSDHVLGLNVGVSNMRWTSDPDRYLDEIARFGKTMMKRGWKVRLITMWDKDLPYVRSLAARLGSEAEVFETFLDLERCFAALRGCRLFVGQKLHSVVLASCAHVPSVMLAYHPKCVEFQTSIGRADFTLATEGLRAEELLAKVETLAEGYDDHRAAVSKAVLARQRMLRAQAAEVRAHMG